MKQSENVITLILVLLLGLMATGLVSLTGCARLAPGQDSVAVRAEQSVASSMETIDAFLKFEAENRLLIQDTSLTEFANKLRKEVPGAFDSYMRVLSAYKANRSAENKLALEGAVGLLDALRREAVVWMVKYGQKAAGPGSLELALLAMAGISNLLQLIGKYRNIAAKTEEWTPEQQAEFEAKWKQTMAKADHWKIPES